MTGEETTGQAAVSAAIEAIEKRIPWVKCPSCGDEYLRLASSGKCGLCTEKDGGFEPAKAEPKNLSLRDRVRAAREELEKKRFR